MPFIKNIIVNTKKGSSPITIGVSATATGSAGYFTASGGKLYSGATSITPINITFTSNVNGGVAPVTVNWLSSANIYPPQYTSGSNTGSFTGVFYSLSSSKWTAIATDSSVPAQIVSASIESIIYGNASNLYVNTTGSDTQSFTIGQIPGDISNPLKTINTGILYAIPSETTIYVASGTYAENPSLNKNIFRISGSGGTTTLSSSNYFIYDSKSLPTASIRDNVIIGFSTSSFGKIGVTPNGLIQTAYNDTTESVYCLRGIHEIVDTITSRTESTTLTIFGDSFNTSSNVEYPTASAILRLAQSTPVLFLQPQSAFTINNFNDIQFELYHSTASNYFLFVSNSRDITLRNVRYTLISSSVGYPLQSYIRDSQRTNRPGINPSEWYINGYVGDTDSGLPSTGTGRARYGNYATYNKSILHNESYEACSIIWFSNFVSGVTTAQQLEPITGSTTLRQVITTNRPAIWFNQPNVFNGNVHLRPRAVVNGSNINFMSTTPVSATTVRSHVYGLCVFMPNMLHTGSFPLGMVWKTGDNNNGFSVAVTGSEAVITFYASSSISGSYSAWITGSYTPFVPYIAEFFFNGNDSENRFKAVLYGTSSIIASQSFTSASFSSSTWTIGGSVQAFHTSILGLLGNAKIKNINNTGSSIRSPFSGSWAASLVSYDSTLTESITRKSFFDFAKAKYFPSNSIVTHGLS